MVVNRMFVWILLINGGMWLATFFAMCWTSSDYDPATGELRKAKQKIYDTCSTVFIMTSGAFVGLIGGRTGAPDKLNV